MTTDLRQVGMISIVLAGMSLGPDAAAVDAGRVLRSPGSISENLKLPFIANQGQHDQSVRFYARTCGGTAFITDDGGIVYSLPCSAGSEAQGRMALRENFIGGQIDEITGGKPASTAVSWFKGSDRSGWKSRLSAFEYIDLGEVYDGVNLRLRAYGNNVEKLFIVDPGADVDQIRVGIDGAVGLSVSGGGELEIMTELGEVMFTKPVAYQDYSGEREYVEVAYALTDTRYGFSVGDYDKTRPLIIDPLLASTFLGGSAEEGWTYTGMIDNAIADDGSVLVAGMTVSTDFPTQTGCYECTSCGGQDIFIARFNPDLSDLLSVATVGGSADDRSPRICTHDGDIYLAGVTYSSNFPTTPGCFDGSYAGSGDVIVVRFDAQLTTLLTSTYIGSPVLDGYYPSIAIDDLGNVFISSNTSDSTFPTAAGAFSQSIAGLNDCFVARLSSDLSTLTAGTFIGGQYDEKAGVLAITSEGYVVLATASESDDYPTTAGVYGPAFHGPPQPGEYIHDVAVSIFSTDLDSLIASTYVGGSDYDGASLVVIGATGSIYVGGHTGSPEYPISAGAFDPVHNGINEFFITRMSADLATLEASTFLTPDLSQGWGFVYCTDMACNAGGSIVLVGEASNDSAYCTPDAYDPTFNGGIRDVHMTIISDDLTEVIYATYLGDTGDDKDATVACDDNGEVYVAAHTTSANFPMIGSPWQSVHGGGSQDCIVAKLTLDQFTRITEGPHVDDYDQSSGVGWIDFNNDGYDDLYVTNVDPENRLYRNNGNGTFTRLSGDIVSCNPGDISSTSSCWSDINNDGYPDVYITNYSESSPPVNTAFINNGDETFVQLNSSAIISEPSISFDATWADYNKDGLIDLFVTSFSGPNSLYRQDDTGFALITTPPIGSDNAMSLSAAWADYDNDGDMDLFVANAFGDPQDYLYGNNGNGNFTKQIVGELTTASHYSWGGSWGDYDNDGDQDLFVTSYEQSDPTGNYDYLHTNNGDGTFSTDTTLSPCLVSARTEGSAWGDYNNDGFLDLFVAVAGPNLLYRNQGDGTFIRITEGDVVTDDIVSRTGAWSDYDRDGDLDLYVANGDYLENSFYENNGNSNSWLVIKCVGVESNRMAIGAKVTVKATIGGNPVCQMREISSRSGGSCQNSPSVHFGLGDAVIIDSIKVEWPSGAIQALTDVDVNQFLNIEEECCNGLTGNVDDDTEDMVDIGDLTRLIDYLFISYTEPVCMEEANTDGEGTVDIGDLTRLIDYLFISYTPPAECP